MHVLFCNWRDTRNPEGGGSERYVETMARGLVERGHHVTIACAAHDDAPRDEVIDGVRFVRRGTKLDIYAITALRVLMRRYGRIDLVVDVQNGLPFFTRLVTRKPVVVLVHHVHREQWPVVHPGLVGRIGWWIESRLAPRIYRAVEVCRRVELDASRAGRPRDRPRPHHDRAQRQRRRARRWMPSAIPSPACASSAAWCRTSRSSTRSTPWPHCIEEHPSATLDVIGTGWWEGVLRDHADAAGVGDAVQFRGFADERSKHELLARAWLLVLPSLKEGWGLVVGEAGSHGTPTIAYSTAGGTTESIAHKDSGLLVDDRAALIEAVADLVDNSEFREFLGDGARRMSHAFTWHGSQAAFAAVIDRARDVRA